MCRIYPRSDLSLKTLLLGRGVIDSHYRGNISVILTNFDSSNVVISKEDRIAQIMFLKKEDVTFKETDAFDDSTVRGIKGFERGTKRK